MSLLDGLLAASNWLVPALAQRRIANRLGKWWRRLVKATTSVQLLQVIIYAIWNIWKKRCRRVFQQQAATYHHLALRIREDVLNYELALQEVGE